MRASTKIVPTAEYNPFECVKTNVTGATHVYYVYGLTLDVDHLGVSRERIVALCVLKGCHT